jgi:hypothetical protein
LFRCLASGPCDYRGGLDLSTSQNHRMILNQNVTCVVFLNNLLRFSCSRGLVIQPLDTVERGFLVSLVSLYLRDLHLRYGYALRDGVMFSGELLEFDYVCGGSSADFEPLNRGQLAAWLEMQI